MRVTLSCSNCSQLLISLSSKVTALLNTGEVFLTRQGRALFLTKGPIDDSSQAAPICSQAGADLPFRVSKAASKLGCEVPYFFHQMEVPVAMTMVGGGGIQINLPSNIDCPSNTAPWYHGLDAKGALASIRARMAELVTAGLVAGYRLDEDGELRGLVSQEV